MKRPVANVLFVLDGFDCGDAAFPFIGRLSHGEAGIQLLKYLANAVLREASGSAKFNGHVSHIGALRTNREVLWIDAPSLVTAMHDDVRTHKRNTEIEVSSNSVSCNRKMVKAKLAVTVRARATNPIPAAVSLFNVEIKPALKGAVMLVHLKLKGCLAMLADLSSCLHAAIVLRTYPVI